MNCKKGRFVEYEFSKSNEDSKVLYGKHRAIVLHSRETPYRTILIAPVTSLKSLKNSNKVPENYLELKKDDYPCALEHDSYINLDMIVAVDEEQIEELEKYMKKINISLNSEDLYKLDFKIALTYELQDFLKEQKEIELKEEVSNIVEYIDVSIKDKVKKIKQLTQDEELLKLIIDIIDNDLIGVLKNTYVNS
ncbi:type II toxin-antitoxin system PemK/MazF family toxin [Clostridium botulinum]